MYCTQYNQPKMWLQSSPRHKGQLNSVVVGAWSTCHSIKEVRVTWLGRNTHLQSMCLGGGKGFSEKGGAAVNWMHLGATVRFILHTGLPCTGLPHAGLSWAGLSPLLDFPALAFRESLLPFALQLQVGSYRTSGWFCCLPNHLQHIQEPGETLFPTPRRLSHFTSALFYLPKPTPAASLPKSLSFPSFSFTMCVSPSLQVCEPGLWFSFCPTILCKKQHCLYATRD